MPDGKVLFILRTGSTICLNQSADDWLTFSLDEGATWTTPIRVGGSNPPCGCDCTHYNGIVEVAPDRLLAVYCRTLDSDDVENGEPCTVDLAGTFFRVERQD